MYDRGDYNSSFALRAVELKSKTISVKYCKMSHVMIFDLIFFFDALRTQ